MSATTDLNAQKLIRAVEEADSSMRLITAVQNLANARLTAAIPTLIQVLGYNNPGAAVAAVDGLIQIGEPAVSPLLEQLDGYNYGARAWAVRALAEIGDPRGLNTLLVAAKTDFAMSVRRSAVKGLGNLHWQELPPEQVQNSQGEALAALIQVSHDHEWIVRYAAVVGLAALSRVVSTRPDWQAQIIAQFEQMLTTDDSLAVCTRIRKAQSN
jgi:phycocyanobilin lyase subunit beta